MLVVLVGVAVLILLPRQLGTAAGQAGAAAAEAVIEAGVAAAEAIGTAVGGDPIGVAEFILPAASNQTMVLLTGWRGAERTNLKGKGEQADRLDVTLMSQALPLERAGGVPATTIALQAGPGITLHGGRYIENTLNRVGQNLVLVSGPV